MSSKKRVLVTGLSGFVGSHLARLFDTGYRDDYQLVGVSVKHDLKDIRSVECLVNSTVPDCVIHLAGQTFVPRSFEDPLETYNINFKGTFNLLSALKKSGFNGRFLYVSSGDVYGLVSESDLPVSESHPVDPRNPYAVSKLSAELLCRQWNTCEDLEVLIARPFNHTGPGQDSRFVLPGVARQLARIVCGRQDTEIMVGDIGVSRDFLHVADVIDAYFSLLDSGQPGVTYNVCSGKAFVVKDLIDELIHQSGATVKLSIDPQRVRKSEQRVVRGDNRLLVETTGWKFKRTMSETLSEILDYWISKER